MTKTLTVIGAGEFGRLVGNLAIDCGYEHLEYFDDYARPAHGKYMGSICGLDSYLANKKHAHLALAVGYKHFDFRMRFIEKYQGKFFFPTLIHPKSFVSKSASIGKGSFVFSMVNVEVGAVIEDFVSVFNQTSISHDVKVGKNCFFSVGIALGGRTQFGKSCFIGVNATVINDLCVGDNCTICASTFLTESIPSDTTVIGNPFKIISKVNL